MTYTIRICTKQFFQNLALSVLDVLCLHYNVMLKYKFYISMHDVFHIQSAMSVCVDMQNAMYII